MAFTLKLNQQLTKKAPATRLEVKFVRMESPDRIWAKYEVQVEGADNWKGTAYVDFDTFKNFVEAVEDGTHLHHIKAFAEEKLDLVAALVITEEDSSKDSITIGYEQLFDAPFDLFKKADGDYEKIASDLSNADFPYKDDLVEDGKTYTYKVVDSNGRQSNELQVKSEKND